jgi:hypothetical protein
MARPIEATPVLKGKDAKSFLKSVRSVVVTGQRMEYLKATAEKSRKAERTGNRAFCGNK